MALQQQSIIMLFLLVLSTLLISFPVKTKCSSNSEYTGLQQEIMYALGMHGYSEMSRSLDSAFEEILYPATTNQAIPTLTIFAPTNDGLLSLETPMSPEEQLINIRPPPLDFTLLEYHMVPLYLEPNNLTTISSTLPTLLYGRNLTVTTSPHNPYPSINNVTIREWNIYNDGRVVVHGVERFLDPNFHLILDNTTATTAVHAPAPTDETYYNNAAAASPAPSEVHHLAAAGSTKLAAKKNISQLLLPIATILSACILFSLLVYKYWPFYSADDSVPSLPKTITVVDTV